MIYTLQTVQNAKKVKIKKKQKIEKKNFFFVFLKFFISDWIYTPKIMTKNLSHVILSWSYRKKVCDMHILCILRHNFQKNCKKKFFFVFSKFFISDRIFTPKTMSNNLSHVSTLWLYTKKVCGMHSLCTPGPTKAALCT